MADSGARRQERYRRHKRGDHGICVPGRCEAVTSPAPAAPATEPDPAAAAPASEPVSPQVPALGPKGRWLWQEATKDGRPAPLQEAMLLEACRIADRLDKLDASLNGDGPWLELDPQLDGRTFVVVVTDALKEARAQAVAFKQLVTELRQSTSAGRGKNQRGKPTERPGEAKGAGGIADLTARIEQRRTSTAG
ncbi:hypothetical protein [Amycolatopsis thermoflava]|uniref:hypothetical protein n=1 Tax=Amycolatopsis thermoflava TaxID=84480 RepID=UPI0038223BDF